MSHVDDGDDDFADDDCSGEGYDDDGDVDSDSELDEVAFLFQIQYLYVQRSVEANSSFL